jgi:hypothetical protein
MDDLGSQDGVKVCHIFHLVRFVKVKFILNMNNLIVKAVHFFPVNRFQRSDVSVKDSICFDATSTKNVSSDFPVLTLSLSHTYILLLIDL